jgi:hypothetical protein
MPGTVLARKVRVTALFFFTGLKSLFFVSSLPSWKLVSSSWASLALHTSPSETVVAREGERGRDQRKNLELLPHLSLAMSIDSLLLCFTATCVSSVFATVEWFLRRPFPSDAGFTT